MKKVFALFLAMIMVFSLGISAFGATIEYTNENGDTVRLSDFRDTEGHWAHDTILKCADYGWIVGNEGNYMPNSPIKRGDLCIVLDRMLGLDTIAYNYFNDLPENSYYRDSVLKCVSMGYINGTSSTTVDPQGFATREQVATIICRMFDLDSTGWRNVCKFNDDSDIGSWAKESVYTMRKYGYMNGDGNNQMNPKANITRAEMITVLNNIAGTYIPLRDTANYGSSFRNDFERNLMVARAIDLSNSRIGRDLIMTKTCRSVELRNVEIINRLFVMNNSNISLSNCSIGQIYLCDGKSNVTGIDKGTAEVYITSFASESRLDSIPVKLTLESGTRVFIDGIMYENNTYYTKSYDGLSLKAAIANEQGYIVGGPRVLSSVFSQQKDNNIRVDNLRITVGKSSVSEVGVIWLYQSENQDVINPTYQNCDGKTTWNANRIGETISFDVGYNRGYCAYRVYVKDSDGLFAYGQTSVFKAYDYDISMQIYDKDYPQQLDAEVIMSGANLPEITSIRVVYDTESTFSENHKETYMSLYVDADSERVIDSSKYRRYTATIFSDYTVDGVGNQVYTPPTEFGYIITFRDGSVINRFPVLTNALPVDVAPTSLLETGIGNFKNEGFVVSGNRVVSRYMEIQEMGIVYKVSNNDKEEKIVADVDGWTRVKSGSLGLDSSATFDVKITDISKMVSGTYTKYAAYIKTSNGYWYSNMRVVPNDYKGDENGYAIANVDVKMLGNNDCIVGVQVVKDANKVSTADFLYLGDFGVTTLGSKEGAIKDGWVYFVLRDLKNKTVYNIPFRLAKATGEMSNVINISINTSNHYDLKFTGKYLSNGYNNYILSSSGIDSSKLKLVSAKLTDNSSPVYVESGRLLVDKNVDVSSKTVDIQFIYYVSNSIGNLISWTFERTLPLY